MEDTESFLASTLFCLRVKFYATENQVEHVLHYDLTDDFSQKFSVIALNGFLYTSNAVKTFLTLIVARTHILKTTFRVWGKILHLLGNGNTERKNVFFQEVCCYASCVCRKIS